MGVIVPRRHPERRLLRVVRQHHADDGFVADTGFGVLGNRDAGTEIAPAVAVAVLRDGQGVQVDVVAQHLDLLDRAVRDHHGLAALGRHLFGKVGADLVRPVEAERRSLAGAVLDQDVGQPPVGEAGHVMEHQRTLAFGTQIAHLGQRIDGVVDMQHPVVDGIKKSAK